MWVQATLARDDLAKVAGELCPLRINIGEGGSIVLSDPRDLDLVPEVGLRLTVTTQLHLDEMDISILPALVDRRIVDRVNKELDAKPLELAWSFTKTLSHVFKLPAALASVGALDLSAAAGRVKITSEAIAFAVSFQVRVEPRRVGPSPALLQSLRGQAT